jgi:hypothetical protein
LLDYLEAQGVMLNITPKNINNENQQSDINQTTTDTVDNVQNVFVNQQQGMAKNKSNEQNNVDVAKTDLVPNQSNKNQTSEILFE